MSTEGDFNHGFSANAWEQAKSEARQVLYEIAKAKGLIAYSELVLHISSVTMDAHDTRLDHFLGEIAREDAEAGKGMTTVLVVHKTGDQMPGSGFFDMARKIGRQVANKEDFWMSELNKVHSYWHE